MIDSAKSLHRDRRKPDLVADGVAMLGAEQRYKSVLDVIGVRDRGRSILRTKRYEQDASLMLSEQGFGGAPSSCLLHQSLLLILSFVENHNRPCAAVKHPRTRLY